MVEKLQSIDITQLPKASEVKSNDIMLLVRKNADGTVTPMKVDGSVLPSGGNGGTSTQKIKQEQYVIGRAIRPRACDQGHMDNWYVFGSVQKNSSTSVAYIPIIGNIAKNHSLIIPKKVYIKKEFDNDDMYREEISISLSQNNQFCVCKVFIDASEYNDNVHLVIGIRVDRYEEDVDGYISAVWLSWRQVSKNIRAASTHHWFEGGYRQYRPIDGDRMFIAERIDSDGELFQDFFSDLEYEAIICKKMNKYNAPGQGKRQEPWSYIKRLVFKRLRFLKEQAGSQSSHAKRVGGLYRAIPIYSICKTKGRPVYFYIRQMVKKISDGNYKDIRRIEWK